MQKDTSVRQRFMVATKLADGPEWDDAKLRDVKEAGDDLAAARESAEKRQRAKGGLVAVYDRDSEHEFYRVGKL